LLFQKGIQSQALFQLQNKHLFQNMLAVVAVVVEKKQNYKD
jgi:hypothetical protein